MQTDNNNKTTFHVNALLYQYYEHVYEAVSITYFLINLILVLLFFAAQRHTGSSWLSVVFVVLMVLYAAHGSQLKSVGIAKFWNTKRLFCATLH